jgi:ribonucleotide monophosphatase NagD (HAD superfamily)
MAYFKAHPDSGVTRPEQIAVVGDRLSTDIMMANMMGSYGVWVRDGVTGRGFVSTSSMLGKNHSHDKYGAMNNSDRVTVCETRRPPTGLPVQTRLLRT